MRDLPFDCSSSCSLLFYYFHVGSRVLKYCMNGESHLYQSFYCWHLILCLHNVDIFDICIKKFDVLKSIFYKFQLFEHSFSLTFQPSYGYFIIDHYPVGVSNNYCLLYLFIKFASYIDMHKILDEFEFRPNQNT